MQKKSLNDFRVIVACKDAKCYRKLRGQRSNFWVRKEELFPLIIEHVACELCFMEWTGDLSRQINKDKRDRKYKVCLEKSTWPCVALIEEQTENNLEKREQSRLWKRLSVMDLESLL